MRLKAFSALFLIFMIYSCTTTDILLETNIDNLELKDSSENNDKEKQEENKIPELTEAEKLNLKIDEKINNMDLRERIGQLFILEIKNNTKVTDQLNSFLSNFKPGGIILFSKNIVNNSQVLQLNKDLQGISNIPFFISVDEEGGIVSRLGKNKNVSVVHLPPALTIGNSNNLDKAFNSGKILGSELKSLGFNMDMAPVADVNTNPQNPVIGNRTYSADPQIAAEMALKVLEGMKSENLISVYKHFPGHGDTTTDSHKGSVVSPHNRDRLDQIEFVPFKMGIDNGLEAIMTAHMIMPGISSSPLPATMNREIITGILREDLGFNGVIMTDALDMGAIIYNFTTEEAVINALKAGVDILLIPLEPEKAFNAILESVKSGEISENRINESVKRILKLKFDYGMFDEDQFNRLSIEELTRNPDHKTLINSVFSK